MIVDCACEHDCTLSDEALMHESPLKLQVASFFPGSL